MATSLLDVLADRVLVADGAMGTMLQAAELSLEDFDGHEGCNEVLNVTRPEVVRSVHERYLAAGADCVTTNSFGANLGNLGEYGLVDRIEELSLASARIARAAVDQVVAAGGGPRFVLGDLGPGTKLPTLGHVSYSTLRAAYQANAAGLLAGRVDALLVETCQDLLQAKAAVVGARRAMAQAGVRVPVICSVTVETTGTMLLGTELGAALTALVALGVDVFGLNCATGPAEMSEHLRQLSRLSPVPLSVMPNAGLPQLGPNGAVYPLTPEALAEALSRFVADYGVGLVGGCCGTTPEHIAAVVRGLAGVDRAVRDPRPEPGVSSLYHHVPFAQDASLLLVGERTNANGSKAFREAMLAGDWDGCVGLARQQARDGSHLLDLCVDYVGRDGVADMRQVAGRLATASTLPVMLDSTEPAVIEAGLESLGGRCVVNSVNFEDGDGPSSRYARVMPLVREHGAAVVALTIDEEGQARTTGWKVRVASRMIDDLTGRWGMAAEDVLVDCLTFPIATGQEETRRDALATIEAIGEIRRRYPRVGFTLGISNVSFGLAAPARQVLNSVFLDECRKVGLTSAIVHASKIVPVASIAEERRLVALDLIYDRRRAGYDPLRRFIDLFAGVVEAGARSSLAADLAGLPVAERLVRRVVDGVRVGLEGDLDAALAEGRSALSIVNEVLLEGMRIVGERFGDGRMQLPFVLESAEVMKAAVGYLEPRLAVEGSGGMGKGRIVLATVKGDVHDIGKNLVDIILSNNGYDVVNLGIKQPIGAILEAAEACGADAIGMSGLLVKSTVVMRDNLAEMRVRGVADRWPVLLGGAALTRSYVERDLRAGFPGEVFYARDAFEGLAVLDRVMAARRGAVAAPGAGGLAGSERGVRRERRAGGSLVEELPEVADESVRSAVARGVEVPVPPFWGTRVVRGVPLGEYGALLDERATFAGQWGLRGARGDAGPSYEQLVAAEGRPRLRYWLDRLTADRVLDASVVYGYFPAYSQGNALVVCDEGGSELVRLRFPRQRVERRLCIADFFRDRGEGLDVVALQLVTVGQRVSGYAGELFAKHAYRDYLEVHGLSVQLTEALAEYWHQRIRGELALPGGGSVADQDAVEVAGLLRGGYRGCRYSFGYPACPDLEQRATVVRLLRPERLGVSLSEEFQLVPEQSTDALVVHHPEAVYFNVR